MKKFKHLILHYQLPQNLQKKLSKILLILSIIVLFYCREISAYTSKEDENFWYIHFVVTERLAMLLLLLSVFKSAKKISWLAAELLLFFLAQDIIDRIFFNVKEIGTNDYITIGLISIIALIKYKNKHNDNYRTNKKVI